MGCGKASAESKTAALVTAQVSVSQELREKQKDLIFGYDKVSNILFNKDEFEDWGTFRNIIWRSM